MRSNSRLPLGLSLAVVLLAGAALAYPLRHSLLFFEIGFLFGFAFFAALALAGRGRLRDLSVLGATVCAMLIAVEGVALFLDSSPRSLHAGRYTQDYIGFDPVLGPAPARAGIFDSARIDQRSGEAIYRTSYTIGDDLIRRTVSSEDGPTIAFFGDSFMFGEGLGDAETLPQAFADIEGRALRILNFGFHGYGPQQFLRTLETGRFDRLLGPDLRLVVFQTAPWHAERTSCQADFVTGSPRYELRNGSAIFAGACEGALRNIVFKQFEKSAAYRLLVQPLLAGGADRDDIELYIAVIARAVGEARTKYGVPTVILYLGYDDAYLRKSGFSNEDVVARLEEAGARVLDATLEAPDGSPLTHYDIASPYIIARDGHPTALAQRRRAEMLAHYLSAETPELLAAGTRPDDQSGSNALR